MLHRDSGRLVDAVAELQLVVALDAAVQRPSLESDTVMLEQVRAELASVGRTAADNAGDR
jgi:hypothetical protein